MNKWSRYSTGSNLNTYSALIQNFYSLETAPLPAVHVTLNTGIVEGEEAGVRAYVRYAGVLILFRPFPRISSIFSQCSSPVGVMPKAENCVFVPVPVELQFLHEAERSGCTFQSILFIVTYLWVKTVDLLINASESPSSTTSHQVPDLEVLETAILNVLSMLDRVLAYVQSVLRGETKGDPVIGRYLMDTLGSSVGMGEEVNGFNGSLQDTIMFSYLSSLARSQAEVSARLALITSSS